MSKAVVTLMPAAFLVAALWALVCGIDSMIAQENNNRAVARLMGCEYIGRLNNVSGFVIHNCAGKLEFVEEIKW